MSEHDCGCSKNPYLPEVATVLEVITESPTIKSFRVRFDNEEAWNNFTYQPGQVGQLSVFGVGESTFVINTPPSCKDYIQFSVMRAGEVTTAIHKLQPGDKVGVRAPLGNYFPYEQWKGKNIVFVGGGIGNGAHPHHHAARDGTRFGIRQAQPAVRRAFPRGHGLQGRSPRLAQQ